MIRELRTLIAVARAGTFAAAGEKVGLTQAAVSAQMQRLEAELGITLFERHGRAARLSKRGEQVLQQAHELIRMYGRLGSPDTEPASTSLVTIGSIASLQRLVVPAALARFHRAYPACRSRVIPGVSMELLNLVDAGDVDMAALIRPPFTLHGDLRWQTLAREPYRLLAPAGTQGDDWAELLSREPFIRYDRASFGGRQVDRFLRDMQFVPHEVCEVDEPQTIVSLVAQGVGVALVPRTASLHPWPAGLRELDLGDHTFHREIGLAYRPNPSSSEEVRALGRLLGECAQHSSGI